MQNQINLLLMLARVCFDNLLLIDELLDYGILNSLLDYFKKQNIEIIQE